MGIPDAVNAADYGRHAHTATISRDRFHTAAHKPARRVSALLRASGIAAAAWHRAPITRAREREGYRAVGSDPAFPVRSRQGTAPWTAARTRSGCPGLPRSVPRA